MANIETRTLSGIKLLQQQTNLTLLATCKLLPGSRKTVLG